MVILKYDGDVTERVQDGYSWAIREGFVWVYGESGRLIRTIKSDGLNDVRYSDD